MTNQTKTTTWALCLSIIAILLCLLVFALWAFEVMPHSVITPDSFIGACVALLGVIVTVAVGWQIFNAIEIKGKVRTIEQVKAELHRQAHRMEQMYDNACHSHGYVAAEQAASRGDYVEAYRWLVSSLQFSLFMDEPINVMQTLNDMKRFADKIPQRSELDGELYKELQKGHECIVRSKSYSLIKDQYDATFKVFKSKVQPVD